MAPAQSLGQFEEETRLRAAGEADASQTQGGPWGSRIHILAHTGVPKRGRPTDGKRMLLGTCACMSYDTDVSVWIHADTWGVDCMIVFLIHLMSLLKLAWNPTNILSPRNMVFLPQGPNSYWHVWLGNPTTQWLPIWWTPTTFSYPSQDFNGGCSLNKIMTCVSWLISQESMITAEPAWTRYPSRSGDPPVAGCQARVAEHGRRKVPRAGMGRGWKLSSPIFGVKQS